MACAREKALDERSRWQGAPLGVWALLYSVAPLRALHVLPGRARCRAEVARHPAAAGGRDSNPLIVRVLVARGMGVMRTALWLDALVTAVHACHHCGRSRPHSAMAARLNELVRGHPPCRAALAPHV